MKTLNQAQVTLKRFYFSNNPQKVSKIDNFNCGDLVKTTFHDKFSIIIEMYKIMVSITRHEEDIPCFFETHKFILLHPNLTFEIYDKSYLTKKGK